MLKHELAQRIEAAKRRASGQWLSILERLGVAAKVLDQRNQPCPACGGKDRFQFTDKYGDGNYVCRGCGPGDGFALLQLCLGWKFIAALHAVEGIVGVAPEPSQPGGRVESATGMRKLAAAIWDEAKPVAEGDAVASYLSARGIVLRDYPAALRTHAALGYYVRGAGQARAKRVATYPAMVAAVHDADDRMVTLQRTYLEQGAKAPLTDNRKLLSAVSSGAAVRLFEASEELAVAEGIETALAVHLSTGAPVWAALSALNLAKLWIPEHVLKVSIYADHDASYTGQAAAYALARRIKTRAKGGRAPEVAVHVPHRVDSDWADTLLEVDRQAQAA
jgi:putative DNA primase/helicase